MKHRGHDYTNKAHEAGMAAAFSNEWSTPAQFAREMKFKGHQVSTYYAKYMVGGEAYKKAAWAILLQDAGKAPDQIGYRLGCSPRRAKELARAGREHWSKTKLGEMLDKHRTDREVIHMLERANKKGKT